MDAISCITGRRSIRQFTDQPVSHELLTKVISTAAFAPSWKNTQVTRYIAVEGDTKARLAACTKIWPKNGSIMEGAPLVVAITAIKGRSGYERDGSFSTPKEDRWQFFDAGIATEAFCLAAYEAGLGSVIMGLYDEDAASVIGVPEDQELIALVAVGFPAENPEAPKRKSTDDLLRFC